MTDAAKLIEDNGWARKWWVLDADGNEVGIYDPAGCQFSLIGAMQRAQPREETAFKPGVENAARREAAFVEDYKARGALIEAILLAGIRGGIKGFDNKVKRTKAEVVAMLRAAAARAEKSAESPPHAWELVRMGLPEHDRGRYSFEPAELKKRARQLSDYAFWEKAAEAQMTETEQVHSVLMTPAWINLYSPGYYPACKVIQEMENGQEMLANVIGDPDGEKMLFGFAAGVRSIATAMRAIHGKTAAARVALRVASDCFRKDKFPPVIALAKALDVEYPKWDGLGYSAQIHLPGDCLGAEEHSFAGAFAADLAMTAPLPAAFSWREMKARLKAPKGKAAGRRRHSFPSESLPEVKAIMRGYKAGPEKTTPKSIAVMIKRCGANFVRQKPVCGVDGKRVIFPSLVSALAAADTLDGEWKGKFRATIDIEIDGGCSGDFSLLGNCWEESTGGKARDVLDLPYPNASIMTGGGALSMRRRQS